MECAYYFDFCRLCPIALGIQLDIVYNCLSARAPSVAYLPLPVINTPADLDSMLRLISSFGSALAVFVFAMISSRPTLAQEVSREEAAVRAGRQWGEAGRMSIVTAPQAGLQNVPGRFAVLRVSDGGPGIARQYLPRLSERFYRVDPGRGLMKGTGLGLAIVKHVVQRHRGEFLVESEPGRGSAFGVVLPLAAD